jgi:phosphoglycolate phosphatase
MPICGVILDLDGTVADTLRDITDSVNVGLAAFGLPPQPMRAVRRFVGDGLRKLCERAMNGSAAGEPGRLDELVAFVLAEYHQHQLDHTRLYDGISALLTGLQQRGVPMAVLSNKPHDATVAMVRALCGQWSFVAVEGCRDDADKKPNPRVALVIAEQMKLAPARVAMVGDAAPDIETARAAGMVAVACTWGFRDRAELAAATPDHLIDRPEQLLALLDERP